MSEIDQAIPKYNKVVSTFYEDRVDRTEGPDGCWYFKGSSGSHGYGQIRVASRLWLAHRFVWLFVEGRDIPEGWVLDHKCHTDSGCTASEECRHRRCVNPNHLEPMTLARNTSIGHSPSAKAARQTHCLHGHEYTDENTLYHQRKRGGTERICRICAREKMRHVKANQVRNKCQHCGINEKPKESGVMYCLDCRELKNSMSRQAWQNLRASQDTLGTSGPSVAQS